MKLHLLMMMSLMVGTWAQEATDQEATDQEATDQEATDQEGTDQKSTDQEGTDQEGTDQESTNQEGTDLQDTAQNNSQAPDEESDSETISKANQEIKSHGDRSRRSRRNVVSCSFCKWPKSRSKVTIQIYFDTSYSSSEKSLIRSAMRAIEFWTCIRFKEISLGWSYFTRHLYIYSGTGCWSYIGRKWWMLSQKVSLNRHNCLDTGTIQHELLHALGFAHEHSRSDRGDHVTIHHENIKPGEKHNFKKHQTNNLYTPYDFKSVMQYSNYGFSRNNQPTLQSKKNPEMDFGFASGVSTYDILRVNRYYGC